MKTSNYSQHAIDCLLTELTYTERKYASFRQEWERLNLECNDLVEQGFIHVSPEIQDNHRNRHATFEEMQELDDKSRGLMAAIEAIKRHA